MYNVVFCEYMYVNELSEMLSMYLSLGRLACSYPAQVQSVTDWSM